jgi:hypothetical protein
VVQAFADAVKANIRKHTAGSSVHFE